jgi:hypothetical protein
MNGLAGAVEANRRTLVNLSEWNYRCRTDPPNRRFTRSRVVWNTT